MLFDLDPASLIARIVVLLIAFTVHEFAHAFTADRFGDPTPRQAGRLTLNPIVHIDPMGALMLLVARFGWAKPVPVNPYLLTRQAPSALMWVSLAGPASNFLMAVLAAIPFRLGLVSLSGAFTQGPSLFPSLSQLLFEFLFINLILMLFNLIPLAPLDGDKIADYFLPPSLSRVMANIRPYGPIILLAIVFVGPMVNLNILGWILEGPLLAIMRILVG
jgi:Zn-dependent protease